MSHYGILLVFVIYVILMSSVLLFVISEVE